MRGGKAEAIMSRIVEAIVETHAVLVLLVLYSYTCAIFGVKRFCLVISFRHRLCMSLQLDVNS